MAASGSDVAQFVVGLALAGLAPILVFPELELMPLVTIATEVTSGLPLHHLGIIAFVAVLGAAWVDTSGSGRTEHDTSQWE